MAHFLTKLRVRVKREGAKDSGSFRPHIGKHAAIPDKIQVQLESRSKVMPNVSYSGPLDIAIQIVPVYRMCTIFYDGGSALHGP